MHNPSYEFHGVPTETARYVVTDTAQVFAAAQYTRNGKSAIAALITCEDHPVRFCLGGSTPVVDVLGHILYVGQSVRIVNPYAVRTFSYINHTAQSAAVLQITFEFEPGA